MEQKFHPMNRIAGYYEPVPSRNRDSSSGDYLLAPVGYEAVNLGFTPSVYGRQSLKSA
jgi:hypothetical protein